LAIWANYHHLRYGQNVDTSHIVQLKKANIFIQESAFISILAFERSAPCSKEIIVGKEFFHNRKIAFSSAIGR